MIPAGLAAWLAGKVGGKALGYIGAAVAALAFTVAVYQTGVRAERKRGEAATLRAEVATLKADIAIAKAAEAQARADADRLAEAARKDREIVDEIEAELAKRPADRRGGLSRDDVRRLRNIR